MVNFHTTYPLRRNFFQNCLKATLLICSFYLPAHLLHAQNMDQLIRSLSTEKNDSLLLQNYVQINRFYMDANPDSAIYYLKSGLDKFTSSNYKIGIITLTSSLATIDGMMGNMDKARQRHSYALKLSREENYSKGIGTALNGLGVIEGRTGNYEEATKYFLEALKVFESTKNERGITNTYIKLGSVNSYSGNLPKALEYNLLVIERSKNDPNISNLLTAYGNIGIIYYKLGQKKNALNAFNKALKMSDSPEHYGTHISCLNSLGNYYLDNDKPQTAMQFYNKGLKLAKERNFVDDIIRFTINIESIRCKRNPKLSLEELEKALALSIKIGQKPLEVEVRDAILRVEAQSKNYKTALDELMVKNRIEDSLMNIKSKTAISELQSTHELKKSKDKVVQLVQSENKTKQEKANVLIVAILLGIGLFGVTYFYRNSKKLNRRLMRKKAELKKSNLIKDRLFSIIGHDLRGPIANIPLMLSLYAESEDETEKKVIFEAINENAKASIDTLDKLLHWGKSQIKGTVITQVEFDATEKIEEVIKLFKGLAEHKQISILNLVPKNLKVYSDPNHFTFVVRNLISNALKFSYSKGTISIEASENYKENYVYFSVTDNGVGIEKDKQAYIFEAFNTSTNGTSDEKGNSIGLMLCKVFIKENGGRIWVESEVGNGTKIYFTIKSSTHPSIIKPISSDKLAHQIEH